MSVNDREERTLSKIKIKYSFCFFVFFIVILGFYKQFLIIFIFVSLHEAGHIISSKIFSLKTDRIIITPIGEIAVIKNIDSVSFLKKFIIFISGPFVNIFFGIIFFYLSKISSDYYFIFFEKVNFLLAFFNLFPVYPLDGGRILTLILNRFLPIMTSNRIIIKISTSISIIFIFLGIVQLILFPYNISLLCIGLYLFRTRSKTFFGMTFNFYKHIINKKMIYKEITPVKNFYIEKNFEIKKIMKSLYYDNSEEIIFEREIVEYIQKKGIGGKISDILMENRGK